MQPTLIGEIVHDEWLLTAIIRPSIELDAFIVMPNHFHAILVITDADGVGAHGCAPLQTPHSTSLYRPPKSLGSIVAGFKSTVTKRANQLRDTSGAPLWQRSFYDRIIRDEQSLNKARQYIIANPAQWPLDRENPLNVNRL